MSDEAQIVLVTGLVSGGVALLGTWISNWFSIRREDKAFRTQTALELAGIERLVWKGDWLELNAQLQRQEARLAVARVPDDLILAFRSITQRSRRDIAESDEYSGGEHIGLNLDFVNAGDAVNRAVRAFLLRTDGRRGREELRRAAVQTTEQVISDPDNRRR